MPRKALENPSAATLRKRKSLANQTAEEKASMLAKSKASNQKRREGN